MHALGWTRQQAIDYVLAHTTETKASAEAEVDRYIAVPGQATAYMIGNLEIRRLRDEAKQKLGVALRHSRLPRRGPRGRQYAALGAAREGRTLDC